MHATPNSHCTASIAALLFLT
ncbi:MAG: hypothetical protein RLZZ562_509, partial [Planctomycetota bacterium]